MREDLIKSDMNDISDIKETLDCGERWIKKWFNNTISLFEAEIKSDGSVDHLCVTSLTVSVKYCEAILILLSHNCRMPAKALLRVLFELASKLTWCLTVPDDNISGDELVAEKIRRWAKYTVYQNIVILKSFRECVEPDELNELENRIREFESIKEGDFRNCKSMPSFGNLIKELPEAWYKRFYPQCYLQFNNAVHLDVNSLGDRVKENGKRFYVDYDSSEPLQDLIRYCVVFEKMVFSLVRSNYGWDTKEMQKEFDAADYSRKQN